MRWSADGGSLYWLTDRDSDFFYLAKYDLGTAAETKLTKDVPGDVERFTLADDGTVAVLVVNEDGRSRLLVIDPRTGRHLPAPRFAEGFIGSVMFRRDSHEFAFEWSCAQSPPGIYSYDLATGRQDGMVETRTGRCRVGLAREPRALSLSVVRRPVDPGVHPPPGPEVQRAPARCRPDPWRARGALLAGVLAAGELPPG